MAWDEDLFAHLDDLEGQAEALYESERLIDQADRSRAEYAAVTLASRLQASLGRPVGVGVLGIGQVRGTLQRAAAQWCLVHGNGQDWVIPTDAITVLTGLSERSVPEMAWSPLTRLGLASALRRIADSGQRCVVRARDGGGHDVVLTRVGADFVEGLEGTGTPVVLGFAAIAAVQSRSGPE